MSYPLSNIFGHASTHKHGGADEIATATPAANAIPKSDSTGKLDAWVSDASASTKGKVQLAVASELVTGTDDTKAPTTKQLKDATALDGFWLTGRTKMPNGATAVYAQDFASGIGGLSNGGNIASIANNGDGSVRITAKSSASDMYLGGLWVGSSIKGKYMVLRAKAASPCGVKLYDSAGPGYTYVVPLTTYYTIAVIPIHAVVGGGLFIRFTPPNAYVDIDWIWIGDYSYLAGSLSEEAARVVNQLGDTAGVGAKATTTLTSNGTNVSNGDTVTIAGKVYTFKTALTPAEGEVLIGATYTDSLDNLVAAITGGAGNGTLYSCAAAHPLVTASRNGAVVTITALQAGILGNQITTSKSASTLTLANPAGGTTTLAGGVDDWGAKAKAQLGAALGAGASVGALPNRTNSNIIGYYNVVDCAAGAQVTLPAGGTWAWMVETYGATYDGVKCGTAAGGAAITGTASANLTMYYERIA